MSAIKVAPADGRLQLVCLLSAMALVLAMGLSGCNTMEGRWRGYLRCRRRHE